MEPARLRLQNQASISRELCSRFMELACPVGNLPSFRDALDIAADAVCIGFRDKTNARHFAGLSFSDKQTE